MQMRPAHGPGAMPRIFYNVTPRPTSSSPGRLHHWLGSAEKPTWSRQMDNSQISPSL